MRNTCHWHLLGPASPSYFESSGQAPATNTRHVCYVLIPWVRESPLPSPHLNIVGIAVLDRQTVTAMQLKFVMIFHLLQLEQFTMPLQFFSVADLPDIDLPVICEFDNYDYCNFVDVRPTMSSISWAIVSMDVTSEHASELFILTMQLTSSPIISSS